jgi:hypothetical protein
VSTIHGGHLDHNRTLRQSGFTKRLPYFRPLAQCFHWFFGGFYLLPVVGGFRFSLLFSNSLQETTQTAKSREVFYPHPNASGSLTCLVGALYLRVCRHAAMVACCRLTGSPAAIL